MRWLALVAGVALIALAIAAVTRVADTREGLIAEIVTLLGALAGVSLLIYGLAARPRPQVAVPIRPGPTLATPRGRSSRDLLLGAAGIALALILLGGLAIGDREVLSCPTRCSRAAGICVFAICARAAPIERGEDLADQVERPAYQDVAVRTRELAGTLQGSRRRSCHLCSWAEPGGQIVR